MNPSSARIKLNFFRGITIFVLFLCTLHTVLGDSQGPLNPSQVPGLPINGSCFWTNRNNGVSDNNQFTVCGNINTNSGVPSQILLLNSYGFTIPAGATINGVELTVYRLCNVPSRCCDAQVLIAVQPNVFSNNKAVICQANTSWSTTLETVTYGGSGDTWGLTLTPSNINTAFSVILTGTDVGGSGNIDLSIDTVKATVYYTPVVTTAAASTAVASTAVASTAVASTGVAVVTTAVASTAVASTAIASTAVPTTAVASTAAPIGTTAVATTNVPTTRAVVSTAVPTTRAATTGATTGSTTRASVATTAASTTGSTTRAASTGSAATTVAPSSNSQATGVANTEEKPIVSGSSSGSVGMIVGIIVGVVGLLLIILIVVIIILVKVRKGKKDSGDNMELIVPENKPIVLPPVDEAALNVPINSLGAHIETLKKPIFQDRNDITGFHLEFNYVEEKSEKHVMDFTTAQLPQNQPKNRYQNVLAPESTRVKLSEAEGSDYVNANYVSGQISGSEKAYIASQGPVSAILHDFWRMVWETNSSVVLMLTKEVENSRLKCDQYWAEVDNPLVVDSFKISLQDISEKDELTTRKLLLENTKTNETRTVAQFQYTAWPDHGVPLSTGAFLELALAADNANSTKGPIVVHCSAGIGRTGTFCAIHSTLKKIEQQLKEKPNEEPKVNIPEVVLALRQQRPNMVQTVEQYEFVYLTINDGLSRIQRSAKEKGKSFIQV